jgi:hypothetical protein
MGGQLVDPGKSGALEGQGPRKRMGAAATPAGSDLGGAPVCRLVGGRVYDDIVVGLRPSAYAYHRWAASEPCGGDDAKSDADREVAPGYGRFIKGATAALPGAAV